MATTADSSSRGNAGSTSTTSESSSSLAAAATPAADGCPVDHKARAAWLQSAQTGSGNGNSDDKRRQQPRAPHPIPESLSSTISSSSSSSSSPSASASSSWKSWFWGSQQSSASASSSTASPTASSQLGTVREISTIPRAPSAPPSPNQPSVIDQSSSSSSTSSANARLAAPSNHENESGTSDSGHWIYPSERMFFDAMRRKQHSPDAQDMASVVPIHNAVNERAWVEIRRWENRFASARTANARCNGPRLASFSGDSSKLTPRARANTWLGYQAPFDRHDWVVERCSPDDTVEYVIDFYQGRNDGSASGGRGLNFYLDVRPKLNTWEGCKMRALSLLGW